MNLKPDDLEILISNFKTMNIEELKKSIDHWEEKNSDYPNQLESIGIAKNELELKCKERRKQIELLTKSLMSSSRLARWISSFKAVLKKFLYFKS